jgi:hypothetical protein
VARVLLTGGENAPLAYVELSVGYSLFAKYRFLFTDADGATIWTKTGHTADGQVDKFAVGTDVARLDGGTLSWKVVTATFDEGDQPFYVEVKVTQDNALVPNGSFLYKGAFRLAKSIADGVGVEVHEPMGSGGVVRRGADE